MKTFAAISMCVLVLTSTFIMGLLVGKEVSTNQYHENAIKAGYAEWVIEYEDNFENLRRTIRWKNVPR